MDHLRLLLADDNPAILESVAKMLGGSFNVTGAFTSGNAVLQEVRRLSPDVIVLDISMGNPNGFEVARQLKKEGWPAKIIFLTVHEDLDYVQAAFAIGADGYVFKTSINDDLVAAIQAAASDRISYPNAILTTSF